MLCSLHMTRRMAAGLLLTGPVAFGQEGLAGTYKGKWTGMSASGDFMIRLEKDGAKWKATVKFSIGDNEVPTNVSLLEVNGSAMNMKYEFDLGGNQLQSHLQGDFQDGMLNGKYKTRAVADASSVIDEGTCSAKRE